MVMRLYLPNRLGKEICYKIRSDCHVLQLGCLRQPRLVGSLCMNGRNDKVEQDFGYTIDGSRKVCLWDPVEVPIGQTRLFSATLIYEFSRDFLMLNPICQSGFRYPNTAVCHSGTSSKPTSLRLQAGT